MNKNIDETMEQLLLREKIRRYERNRHLDGPPKVIRFKQTNPTNSFSISKTFTQMVNMIKAELPAQECYIDFQGSNICCEYIPFIILKALALYSVSKDKTLSAMATKLFRTIIAKTYTNTDHGLLITKDSLEVFLETISPTKYYSKQLLLGIGISAFPKKYLKIYWHQIAYSGEDIYPNAIAAGDRYIKAHPEINDIDKLDEFVKAQYSKASKDKAFMSMFAAGVPTKALIGMTYATFIDDNTVFKLHANSEEDPGGFMS